jgi:tetratricopeptide (TPR) repeat protein
VAEARSVLEEVLAEAPDLGSPTARSACSSSRRASSATTRPSLEGDAAVAFEQGLSALETGEWTMAATSFANARDVTDAGLLAFYQGYALQRAGDSRGAIAAYGDARAQLGDNDILLSNLGFAHLQLGRLDLALEALQAAVASNPGNAQAHFNLGLAEFGVARFVAASRASNGPSSSRPSSRETAEPFLVEARRRSQ